MAPPRIVSLVSSATEILFGLGLGEQVVGISHECDWPRAVALLPRLTRSRIASDAPSGSIDAQVRELLLAGEPLYELDVELLELLRPDLIVTQAQCDVCAVRYDDVVSAVQRSPKLSRTQIVALAPTSLDEVLADILRVGGAAEVPERAIGYVNDLKHRLHDIGRTITGIPAIDRPRVCVIEWFDPLIVAGNWVLELIELAGGRNGLSQSGSHSPVVAWDDLLKFDPEVLILAPCGFDVPRAEQELPGLAIRDGYPSMVAVRSGRVHIADGNAYFNRPGPRLVDTLELLAALVHPSRFSASPPINNGLLATVAG